MLSFILWYILITLLGLLAFPLIYKFLPGLADRGYTLARTLGLLVWSYLFWLFGSLGVLRNDIGGQLFILILLAALGFLAWRSLDGDQIRRWLRKQRRMILIVEVLFLLAFAGWTIVRAANPDIVGTEKPMELAFINAILRSPTLPPHDPWLSGYSISYYYFGYVMVAMLARLTGTLSGVAFNLGISLVFGLGAIGSYGLLYNLLAVWNSRPPTADHRPRSLPAISSPFSALLGPFFVLIVSNLSGLLHILRVNGVFWRQTTSGEWVSSFWAWLDIGSLSEPPTGTTFQHWWWWQGSRIVQDYDYLWNNKGDIIDEFPFFSFLLADLHPHVLALPFAFLAMALALNLLVGKNRGQINWLGMRLHLDGFSFGLAAFALGALGFLNTWDFPFYVALFAGAYVFRRLHTESQVDDNFQSAPLQTAEEVHEPGIRTTLNWIIFGVLALALGFINSWDYRYYIAVFVVTFVLRRWRIFSFVRLGGQVDVGYRPSLMQFAKDFLGMGFALGVTGGLAYLPFYLGFSSQAGGLIPNLIYITKGVYEWIMFAPLLIPIFGLLFYLWKQDGDREQLVTGLKVSLLLIAILLAATVVLTAVIAVLHVFEAIDSQAVIAASAFLGSLQAPGWQELIVEGFSRRLTTPGTLLTLVLMLVLIIALLWPRRAAQQAETHSQAPSPAHTFALLLTLLGALLVLAPEFFFLRDFFGYRINTIFKFYFLAWLLWSVAAAYATIVLWRKLSGGAGLTFRIVNILVLILALLYPLMGLWTKTNAFNPPQWELDGTAHLARHRPDEAAAIQWLREAPLGVVAESIGGSYSGHARFSTHSGQPTVLGWVGHEHQWRGGFEEMGSRQDDIARLYCVPNWPETVAILEQYHIRYIAVGGLERITYVAGARACPAGLSEAKFVRYLEPAFQQGDVTIYEVP